MRQERFFVVVCKVGARSARTIVLFGRTSCSLLLLAKGNITRPSLVLRCVAYGGFYWITFAMICFANFTAYNW